MTAVRTYKKTTRAEGEARTRSALLDAAVEAFLSRPWDQLPLESVASDAGVSKQTLLRHFGSKQGLLEAAFERANADITEQRFSAPTDDIAGAIDNLLDHYDEYGAKAIRLANMEATGPVATIARQVHYDWVDHAFGAWLADEPPARSARLRAALIVTCDVQTWWNLSEHMGLSRKEIKATLALTIRRLLEDER